MLFFARIATLLLFGILTAAPQAETLYKSVDPSGRIVYSDRPPTEGRVEKTMHIVNPPSSVLSSEVADRLRKLNISPSSATHNNGVVLFSATWCGYCKKAKAYLGTKGITYREFDIDTNDGLTAYAQAGGRKGVPLLVSGSQSLKGFSPQAYDEFFANQK